jgi:hypothetical protein
LNYPDKEDFNINGVREVKLVPGSGLGSGSGFASAIAASTTPSSPASVASYTMTPVTVTVSTTPVMAANSSSSSSTDTVNGFNMLKSPLYNLSLPIATLTNFNDTTGNICDSSRSFHSYNTTTTNTTCATNTSNNANNSNSSKNSLNANNSNSSKSSNNANNSHSSKSSLNYNSPEFIPTSNLDLYISNKDSNNNYDRLFQYATINTSNINNTINNNTISNINNNNSTEVKAETDLKYAVREYRTAIYVYSLWHHFLDFLEVDSIKSKKTTKVENTSIPQEVSNNNRYFNPFSSNFHTCHNMLTSSSINAIITTTPKNNNSNSNDDDDDDDGLNNIITTANSNNNSSNNNSNNIIIDNASIIKSNSIDSKLTVPSNVNNSITLINDNKNSSKDHADVYDNYISNSNTINPYTKRKRLAVFIKLADGVSVNSN